MMKIVNEWMQLSNSLYEWIFFIPFFFHFSPIHLYEFTISGLNITGIPAFFLSQTKICSKIHMFLFSVHEKLTGKYIVHLDDRRSICQPTDRQNIFKYSDS